MPLAALNYRATFLRAGTPVVLDFHGDSRVLARDHAAKVAADHGVTLTSVTSWRTLGLPANTPGTNTLY